MRLLKFAFPVFVAMVCVVVFFYPVVLSHSVLYCCDNLAINIPAKVMFVEELLRGNLTLWNPYIFSGAPFLSDSNLSLLFPTTFIFAFLPPFEALTLSVISMYCVAWMGIYVLGRFFRLHQISSMSAATIYTFSGVFVVYTNNIPMIQVAALLPWVCWSLCMYMTKNVIHRYLIAVLSCVLLLLGGHMQLAYYALLFVAIFCVLSYRAHGIVQTIWRLLKVFGLAGMISAVQLIPFIEQALSSSRIGLGYEYATFDSLKPLSVLRMILPSIAGNLASGIRYIDNGSIYGYVGFLTACCLYVAPFHVRRVRILWGCILTGLLLALGKYSPIYFIAYVIIPGIRLFRSPSHFILIVVFASALLAGYGIEALLRWDMLRKITYLKVLSWALLILGALLWVIAEPVASQLIHVNGIGKFTQSPKVALLTVPVLHTFFRSVAENIIGVSVLLFGFVFIYMKKIQVLHWGYLVLICIELFTLSKANVLLLPKQTLTGYIQNSTPLVQREDDEQLYRIYVEPSTYTNPYSVQWPNIDIPGETAWQLHILRTNLNTFLKAGSPDGYGSMVYEKYKHYISPGTTDPTGVDLSSATKDTLDTLGVRNSISYDPTSHELEQTYRASARPRFELVTPDTQSRFDATYTPGNLIAHTEATGSGIFVFRETNYPGWHALVDGKCTRIESHEDIFQRIAISSGVHTIRLFYMPYSFLIGTAVSIGGIAIVCFLVHEQEKKRKKYI